MKIPGPGPESEKKSLASCSEALLFSFQSSPVDHVMTPWGATAKSCELQEHSGVSRYRQLTLCDAARAILVFFAHLWLNQTPGQCTEVESVYVRCCERVHVTTRAQNSFTHLILLAVKKQNAQRRTC